MSHYFASLCSRALENVVSSYWFESTLGFESLLLVLHLHFNFKMISPWSRWWLERRKGDFEPILLLTNDDESLLYSASARSNLIRFSGAWVFCISWADVYGIRRRLFPTQNTIMGHTGFTVSTRWNPWVQVSPYWHYQILEAKFQERFMRFTCSV